MILTTNDIKAELSYAYLHAVASRARLACDVAGRLSDGAGVDAVVRAKEKFDPESIYTSFTVDIQLKATSTIPLADDRDRYPFSLTLDQYDKLRDVGNHNQRLLVVFYLPADDSLWLGHSEDGLIARRCAYWVSLYGAPTSSNAVSQTVYIPRANVFSPASLRSVMTRVSLGEKIPYEL